MAIQISAWKYGLHVIAFFVALMSFLFAMSAWGIIGIPAGLSAESLVLGLGLLFLGGELLQGFSIENKWNWVSLGVEILGVIILIGMLTGNPITMLDAVKGFIYLLTGIMIGIEVFTKLADVRK